MRKMFRALLMGLGLLVTVPALAGVAGCASFAQLTHNASASTADEKALLTAEFAFDGALSVIESADHVGALTPARAAQIAPYVTRAHDALLRARSLYDANQTVEAGIATGDATQAITALVQAMVDVGIARS